MITQDAEDKEENLDTPHTTRIKSSYISSIQPTPTLLILRRVSPTSTPIVSSCIQPLFIPVWHIRPCTWYINPRSEIPNKGTSHRCYKHISHQKRLYVQNHTLKHNKIEGAMCPLSLNYYIIKKSKK